MATPCLHPAYGAALSSVWCCAHPVALPLLPLLPLRLLLLLTPLLLTPLLLPPLLLMVLPWTLMPLLLLFPRPPQVDKTHHLKQDAFMNHAEKCLQLGEKPFVSGGMKAGK